VKGNAPRIAIGSPANGATTNRLLSIVGRAVDADAASTLSLSVTLRASDGRFWNGRALQATPFAIPVTSKPLASAGQSVALNWSAGSSAFFQNLPAGMYTATAQVRDDSGLASQATASVRVLALSAVRS
jgi:hypothetical protein